MCEKCSRDCVGLLICLLVAVTEELVDWYHLEIAVRGKDPDFLLGQCGQDP